MTSIRHRYSCEPSRTSAYNDNIRWRIVWQKEVMKLSDKEVATNLCIDPTTVHRISMLFRASGDVKKKPYPAENAFRKLTKPVQFFWPNYC